MKHRKETLTHVVQRIYGLITNKLMLVDENSFSIFGFLFHCVSFTHSYYPEKKSVSDSNPLA
jgi:hypothetical protein